MRWPLARNSAPAFRMDDASACGHPVDVAGTDGLNHAQTVTVHQFALEQIGDRGQPDMRMRPHVDALPRRERDRPI